MATVKTLIGNIKGKPGADGDKNVYSTSEAVIGTWNGSTLYRRIISTTIPVTNSKGTQTTKTVSTGVSFKKLVAAYISYIVGSSYSLSTIGYSSSDDLMIWGGEGNVTIGNSNPTYNGTPCYVVIEYIK